MDWLRRNWPDLIIGVALIAVVALIVVTLLSGGSLASLVRRDDPPAITGTTPGTVTPADAPADTLGAGGNTQTAGNSASGTPSAGSSAGNTASSNPDPNETGVDVFVPGVPGGQAGTAAGASGGQAQAEATPGGAQSSGGVAQSGAQEGQANASGPLPEATPDGGFRVAAGAVDSRDAAASLAETFREDNYTVTVEQQGELYLLWVGPYAARAGADQVAARLQTDGLVPDALVYSYDGPDNNTNSGNANSGNTNNNTSSGANRTGPDSPGGTVGNSAASGAEGAGANAGAAAGSANTAANTGNTAPGNTTAGNTAATSENTEAASTGNAAGNSAANTGAATTATAPSGDAAGQRYLQVGAFATDASAQPLREQLESLGFNVVRRQSGTGLVRLLVGPLGDAQLAPAQTRLSDAGITDAFPVAP